jgi:hypothetical protein
METIYNIETGNNSHAPVAQPINNEPILYTSFNEPKPNDRTIRSILVKTQPGPGHDTNLQMIVRRVLQGCVIIFSFPMIFADLYFGFNSDPQCINQSVKEIQITMAQYLLGNGFYNLFMLCVSLSVMNCVDISTNTDGPVNRENFGIKFGFILLNILGVICRCISTAWNITGSVLFWAYFDKNLCNANTNNYINISLIIKLVFVALAWCMSGKTSKNQNE